MSGFGFVLYLGEECKVINNFGSCRNCDIEMIWLGFCFYGFIEKRY